MYNRTGDTVVLSLALFIGGSEAAPATAGPKDGRPVFSLSKDGLTVNGTRVQVDRTTKAELEKLLGPLERTVTCQPTVHR